MSKIKCLLEVVQDMHNLADSIKEMADAISCGSVDESANEEACADAKETAKVPTVTLEQVREVLAEKSSEGKTAEVKALLYKYDAGKLSGVKPQDYAALCGEARKL